MERLVVSEVGSAETVMMNLAWAARPHYIQQENRQNRST